MCLSENLDKIYSVHNMEYDMLDGILLLREFDNFPTDTDEPTDIEAEEIMKDFIYVYGQFTFNDGTKLTKKALLERDWRNRLRQLILALEKMN